MKNKKSKFIKKVVIICFCSLLFMQNMKVKADTIVQSIPFNGTTTISGGAGDNIYISSSKFDATYYESATASAWANWRDGDKHAHCGKVVSTWAGISLYDSKGNCLQSFEANYVPNSGNQVYRTYTFDLSKVKGECYFKAYMYGSKNWAVATGVSSSVTLTPLSSPLILGQSDEVTVIQSETATFSVDTWNANTYQWQKYDEAGNTWTDIEGAKNHTYEYVAEMDDNGSKYRCKVSNSKTSIYSKEIVLTVKRNGYKKIIASYYKNAEAGSEINVSDVLVGLIYENGEPDIATGWSNLYFIDTKDVITSTKENEDGSKSEIVETVTEEVKTYKVKYGDNEVKVRLKDESASENEDFTKEATFHVTGTDSVKPYFKNINVSDFDVINEDQTLEPVDITVTLEAEDNYTEKSDLLYALKLDGEELIDSDFSIEETYKLTLSKNSLYKAYVKDIAGNITSKDVELIIVDNEDPVIVSKSLIFKEEDGWVTKNIIQIEATDNYRPDLLKYRFSLPESISDEKSEESEFGEWLDSKEIVIKANGEYTIEVKDSVGNITKEIMKVTNIDGLAPEIENIEIKTLS